MRSLQSMMLNLILRRTLKRVSYRGLSIAQIRAQMDEFLTRQPPLPPDARIVQVSEAAVRGEWVQARNVEPRRTLLYFHGGAYIMGSPATHRHLTYRLARQSAARVFALDYRLAPEHPFPAAVDDAVACYRWLLDRGVAPESLVLGGDSAGGGLTLAALVALRDAGLPLPAAAICLSPWTDLAATGQSIRTNADADPMFNVTALGGLAAHYLGNTAPTHPLVSPLYADLRGLPPLLIQVGSTEILLDDSRRIAERARAAGVSAEIEIWSHMPHVWHLFAPRLPEGRRAIAKLGRFIAAREAARPLDRAAA